MEGHQQPWAGGPPQDQPQPPHDAASQSPYTNYPEVAPNSPDSAAPQVAYDASPETVPLQHYGSYKQHASSDESPTFAGHDFEDKHLANPVLNSSSDKQLAYTDYRSMGAPPAGLEPALDVVEKPVAVKKNRKKMWIIVAIAILLVIGAAIGGGVGGTMAARNKAAEEAAAQLAANSQSVTSSTSQTSTTPTPQTATSSASQSTTASSSSSILQPNRTSSGSSSRPTPVASGKPGEVCVEGTGDGNFLGLCTFSCQYGYVPAPCTCLRFGAQVQPPPATGQKGYPRVDVPDRCSYLGLCSFAWDRGYTDNLAACSSDPAGGEGCL